MSLVTAVPDRWARGWPVRHGRELPSGLVVSPERSLTAAPMSWCLQNRAPSRLAEQRTSRQTWREVGTGFAGPWARAGSRRTLSRWCEDAAASSRSLGLSV